MNIHELSMNHSGVSTSDEERFGIEIEVEHVMLPGDLGVHWNVVEDGSLRNSGFEFVSRPLTYEQLLPALDTYYGWHNEHAYRTSLRTSTHVHYNVLPWTMQEVAAAMTVYAIVEPLMFRVCGEDREENVYCVPWYRGEGEARIVRNMDNDDSSLITSACKYSALYLEPLSRFGTVEFRQAPVFDDADSLLTWVNLIRKVMSKGRELGTVAAVLDKYYQMGANAFVQYIFEFQLSGDAFNVAGQDFEAVIEEVDSIGVAESCLLGTYQATPWQVLSQAEVAEDLTAGYHRVAFRSRGPSSPSMEYDEEYREDADEYGYEE